jgi:hypothetical protein
MLNQKNALFGGGLLTLVLFAWDRIGNYQLCDMLSSSGHEGNCPFFMISAETVLLPIIPFFLFALITYFMREEVYKAWSTYAFPMLGVAMLLTAIMPDSHGGGFGPQIAFGKPDVAVLSSIIFIVVSIVIILRARR